MYVYSGSVGRCGWFRVNLYHAKKNAPMPMANAIIGVRPAASQEGRLTPGIEA
jgi:hypothetical protein